MIVKKILSLVVLLMLLAMLASAQQPVAPKTQLKVGDRAPDFMLIDTNRAKVNLSDFITVVN
jgi:peroxiredoxin